MNFLPESIDVAAGLVFVYLFMSALATIGREAFEGFVKRRARNLEKGLTELLCDHPPIKAEKGKNKHSAYDMLKAFYDHPLIMTLYRGRYAIPGVRNFWQGRNLPSYIPSAHFAYVVLDMLDDSNGQGGALNLDNIAAAAANLKNRRLAKMVQFAVHNSGGDVDRARQFLETWFNASMDRVSGWYRLETQTILFWISLIACIVLNVNTVVIADSLWRSPSLRKTVEAEAEHYYRTNPDAIAALPSANVGPTLATPKVVIEAAPPAPVTPPAAEPAPAVEPAADTASQAAKPAADEVVTAPGSAPISAKEAFKAAANADVPGATSPTDPLEKLGLPLGWNKQTISAMHRLFPQPPVAQTENQQKVAWQEHVEARRKAAAASGAAVSDNAAKSFDLGRWARHEWRKAKALWQDTLDSYRDGGQDPAKNALFNAAGTLSLFMGWVMTAFAVTLGAPFWFDVLGKLMMVRSTLKPDGKGGKSLDMGSLSAIASSLVAPNNDRPALLPYNPGGGQGSGTNSAAAAQPSGDDSLRNIDPNDRPRDS